MLLLNLWRFGMRGVSGLRQRGHGLREVIRLHTRRADADFNDLRAWNTLKRLRHSPDARSAMHSLYIQGHFTHDFPSLMDALALRFDAAHSPDGTKL
jgi:hypothetical protein